MQRSKRRHSPERHPRLDVYKPRGYSSTYDDHAYRPAKRLSYKREQKEYYQDYLDRQHCVRLKDAKDRALCDLFYQKLPRELRDMVYENLIPGDRISILKSFGCRPADAVYERRVLFFGYYFDYFEQFSPGVRHEFTEMFYRRNTFDIHDADNIHEFLNRDPFYLSDKPKQFLRHLIVALRVDLINNKHGQLQKAYPNLCPYGETQAPVLFNHLVYNFRALGDIENLEGFKLDVDVQTSTSYVSIDDVLFTLETITPTVRSLENRGVKVRFMVDNFPSSQLFHLMMGRNKQAGDKNPDWWDNIKELTDELAKWCSGRGLPGYYTAGCRFGVGSRALC